MITRSLKLDNYHQKELAIGFDLEAWMIGVNWHKCKHEIEDRSFFSIHILCVHIIYQW